MKIFFLSSFTLFIVIFYAQAQFQKDTVQIGGIAGFSKRNISGRPNNFNLTDYENRTWSVLPQAGYFINRRTSIGLGIGYVHS